MIIPHKVINHKIEWIWCVFGMEGDIKIRMLQNGVKQYEVIRVLYGCLVLALVHIVYSILYGYNGLCVVTTLMTSLSGYC